MVTEPFVHGNSQCCSIHFPVNFSTYICYAQSVDWDNPRIAQVCVHALFPCPRITPCVHVHTDWTMAHREAFKKWTKNLHIHKESRQQSTCRYALFLIKVSFVAWFSIPLYSPVSVHKHTTCIINWSWLCSMAFNRSDSVLLFPLHPHLLHFLGAIQGLCNSYNPGLAVHSYVGHFV